MAIKIASKQQRSERGQSLIEFAFLAPFLLVLIMGIVDFGWALKSYITVTNSSREGARLGVTCVTNDEIKTRVVDHSSGLLEASDVTSVTNPCKTTGGQPGDPVVVKVEYDYTFITPLGGLLSTISWGSLPSQLHMTVTTKMRAE